MKKAKQHLLLSILLLAAFTLWTAAVLKVDVQPVGPQGSRVGFASLNLFVHRLTGVHFSLYHITDWLSLIPVFLCAGFAALGLCQWIERKRLLRVDRSLLILGGFYVLVIAIYLFFERFVVNYRPVLIGGALEASYPSSTTVLVLCVMPTAAMQLRARARSKLLRKWVSPLIAAFTAFMIAARLISGVHWATDIVGGALISAALVTLVTPFLAT